MRLVALIAPASLFTGSCMQFFERPIHTYYAPTRSAGAGQSSATAANPWEIEVYRTERPVGPIEEIGTVYADSTSLPKAIDVMRAEAARQGGHAIIDIKITSDGIVGTVVRYK